MKRGYKIKPGHLSVKNMEQPKIYSKAVQSKIEEERKRVDDLRKTDNRNQDAVYDLAQDEEVMRGKMSAKGVPREAIDELANDFSTVNLKRVEAQKSNWIDEMTDLKNREALNGEIPKLLSLEKREGRECSLLMIDFDYFKLVNDDYGHPAGDQALKVLADVIRNSIRRSDFSYRYGGEEFVVFMLNTNQAQAQEVAEKIRHNVERARIVVLDKDGQSRELNKTVSIGCVGTDTLGSWKNLVKDDDGGTVEIKDEMIAKADQALYQAKEAGRNRTAVSDL